MKRVARRSPSPVRTNTVEEVAITSSEPLQETFAALQRLGLSNDQISKLLSPELNRNANTLATSINEILQRHYTHEYDSEVESSDIIIELANILNDNGNNLEAATLLIKQLSKLDDSFENTELWKHTFAIVNDIKSPGLDERVAIMLALRIEISTCLRERIEADGWTINYDRESDSAINAQWDDSLVALVKSFIRLIKEPRPQSSLSGEKLLSDRSTASLLKIAKFIEPQKTLHKYMLDSLHACIMRVAMPSQTPPIAFAKTNTLLRAAEFLTKLDFLNNAFDLLVTRLSLSTLDEDDCPEVDEAKVWKAVKNFAERFQPQLDPCISDLLRLRIELNQCVEIPLAYEFELPNTPNGELDGESRRKLSLSAAGKILRLLPNATNGALDEESRRKLSLSMAGNFLRFLKVSYEANDLQHKSDRNRQDSIVRQLMNMITLGRQNCKTRREIGLLAKAQLARLARTPLNQQPTALSITATKALATFIASNSSTIHLEARMKNSFESMKANGFVPKIRDEFTADGEVSVVKMNGFEPKKHAEAFITYIESSSELRKIGSTNILVYLESLATHIDSPSRLLDICLSIASSRTELFNEPKFSTILSRTIDSFENEEAHLEIIQQHLFKQVNMLRNPYFDLDREHQRINNIIRIGNILANQHEYFKYYWRTPGEFSKFLSDHLRAWKWMSKILQGSLLTPIITDLSMIASFQYDVPSLVKINQIVEALKNINSKKKISSHMHTEVINLIYASLRSESISFEARVSILCELATSWKRFPKMANGCPAETLGFVTSHIDLIAGLPIACVDPLQGIATELETAAGWEKVKKEHFMKYLPIIAKEISSNRTSKLMSNDEIDLSLQHLHQMSHILNDDESAGIILDLLQSPPDDMHQVSSLVVEQMRVRNILNQQ